MGKRGEETELFPRKMRSQAQPPSLSMLLIVLFVTPQCFQIVSSAHGEQSKLYLVYLGEKQHEDPDVVTASHHDILTSVLGRKEDALRSIAYSYRHGFSGFAATLAESQAKRIAELPEVVSIVPNRNLHLHTTRSWDFMGLGLDHNPKLPENLLHKANHGEGIIIGIVDSGVWPESKSFDDAGYSPIPSRWRGKCQVGQNFTLQNCNKKIIGARYYTAGTPDEDLQNDFLSPRDTNTHGTHTASTAAGNIVPNASFNSLGAGTARGGAPRARLAIYKVGWGERGFTPLAAGVKAIDDAIHDGVDVLSLSLGWDLLDYPYATLHAVEKGITVVFAGGNSGPGPQTMESDAPWVITVAASTLDRSFPTMITLGNNQQFVAQSMYTSIKGADTFFEIILDTSCDLGLANRTENIAEKIVLCYPDNLAESLPFVYVQNAIANMLQIGAKGLIVAHYNVDIVGATANCLSIPCVLIDFEAQRKIYTYIGSTRTPKVKISPTQTIAGDSILAPKLAAFSSRGPSAAFPGLIKPDIAAPGSNILAAGPGGYFFDTGTSMACPHVAGIAALLKSLHPDWSPAAIKSALVTTASTGDAYGEPIAAESSPRKLADPFDFGGGHVNPNAAADPGLVYDINPKDFFKFFQCAGIDCNKTMSNLYDLNLPSISIHDLKTAKTVSRTVTNVGKVDSVYKAVVQAPIGVKMVVKPSVLHFNVSMKIQTFKVSFVATRKVQGDYSFGSLTWVEDHGTHSVRIPIAVRRVIVDSYSDVGN
ncbi:uncharacterized protein A4U43_C04F11740 [Asparagus officinalis]|uniref:Subtilisin-like protease n=1 Tax=Asparagus officinalis TaxID=4686 RepID=A0A5P1F2U5_ASPOF|nr:subtilisin-like protease SBT3.8 isoform X2 [Asparagus officinalis]ONK71727.1 uncharacterized protein A4U43_C04F11740 [Asparagus officinalis]